MHLVQQLTPFTCTLACIESIVTDLGTPISQCELLKKYKDCLIGSAAKIEQFGAANGDTIIYILNDLGFRASHHQDFRLDLVRSTLRALDHRNHAVMISANFNLTGWHSVRWNSFDDQDRIVAMNPSFSAPRAQMDLYKFDDLVLWDFSFLIVSPF